MQLWLDAGNTRVKWQLWEKGAMKKAGAFAHYGRFEVLEDTLTQEFQVFASQVESVGLACVLNADARHCLIQALEQCFSVPVRFAEVSKTFLGFSCAYEDVNRLGVDRWLASLAAFRYYQSPVLVVSCGSALTIDATTQCGQHLGGYILPGLAMAQKALLGDTHAVRFDPDDAKLDSLEYGRDTASAVNNGLLLQASAIISEAWQRFSCSRMQNTPRLVLTGGDAPLIASHLTINVELHDDLVLQGLRLALELTDTNNQ